MPRQILPFTGLDQVGVNKDTPPVALPPNAFSDVRNVRFKDGAVRKMEGEVNIFPGIFYGDNATYDGNTLKYVVWWPNPNRITANKGYYLVIREETRDDVQVDVAYLLEPTSISDQNLGADGFAAAKEVGMFTVDTQANWQHTFFQGGFALIINNGNDVPHFILDEDGNRLLENVPVFQPLPGWESYMVNDRLISDTFNAATDNNTFSIGPVVDFNSFRIAITIAGEEQTPITETTDTRYSTEQGIAAVTLEVEDGQNVTVNIQSLMPVFVRAGVIRSYGDFLVAGNFTLRNENDEIIRNLAGVVRTSDVAPPGSIPTNWNPYAAGVSTADEFIITASGVVQDMAELQGNLYIYSNSSISVMRPTGNATVPLAVQPITESYGAQTTEAVLEFDGRHLVVGSQDIYLFAGHPGSIQSVSDQRVRRFFFDNLNPLHNQRMFMLRYAQRDEIWICFPTTSSIQGECDEALIWNYRQNIWTQRSLAAVVAGDVGPVPGGGLPTSTNTFSENGISGNNRLISDGLPTVKSVEFTNPPPFSILGEHGGQSSQYTITVSNTPEFEAGVSSFNITFGEMFDTGPTFVHEEDHHPNFFNPDVNYATPPATISFGFINPSVATETVTLPLPRFLTTDKEWDAEDVYFANIDGGEGQRVIYSNVIYRVRSSPDGSTPSTFYTPDEDGEHYTDENGRVYHDTFDVVGIPPIELVEGAPYENTPGDGGTGQTIQAADARWEIVGPASVFQRGVEDVAAEFAEFLAGQPTFTENFQVRDINVADGSVIVEANFSSGEKFDYLGILIEENYPDNVYNGGNIEDFTQDVNPNTQIAQGDAVILEYLVREREYIDFDPADISNTGRYATTETSSVLDRILVSFNGMFNSDADVAAVIAEGFRMDPQTFWTVGHELGQTVITLTSAQNGNFSLDQNLSAPDTLGFPSDAFVVVETQVGTRNTDGTAGGITPQPPYFSIVPPDVAGEETKVAYIQPAASNTAIIDPNTLMTALLESAIMTYDNWEVLDATNPVQVQTSNSDNPALPASLRQANRETTGEWTITAVAPGNAVSSGTSSLLGGSTTISEGVFSLSATPSYLGVLTTNPSTPSGYEFFLLEAGEDSPDDMGEMAADVVSAWVPRIRNAVPRVSLVEREDPPGFFLQPANYDSLANFILDVRLNDTPANADWIYQLSQNQTTTIGDETITGITINPASDIPPFVNGVEEDDVFDASIVPLPTDPGYLRIGGPLKVAQISNGMDSRLATLRVNSVTTLIFDVFRPWPKDEVNFNLEYPILCSVALQQDTETGLYHRINKILGADISWSRPTYSFTPRVVEADIANFREFVTDGDDKPEAYESYVERQQLALTPEFTTEEISSIALWADGASRESLMGDDMHNRLDIQMVGTDYPGQTRDLNVENTFMVTQDYKSDVRIHGRFINFRITDQSEFTNTTEFNQQVEWRLSGIQAEVKEGGRR